MPAHDGRSRHAGPRGLMGKNSLAPPRWPRLTRNRRSKSIPALDDATMAFANVGPAGGPMLAARGMKSLTLVLRQGMAQRVEGD